MIQCILLPLLLPGALCSDVIAPKVENPHTISKSSGSNRHEKTKETQVIVPRRRTDVPVTVQDQGLVANSSPIVSQRFQLWKLVRAQDRPVLAPRKTGTSVCYREPRE
jgi:hypothetical protein